MLTAFPPCCQVCEQSCAALCMLALRKPENCRVIMEGGGALAALQAMKTHPREAAVQVLGNPWVLPSPLMGQRAFCMNCQSSNSCSYFFKAGSGSLFLHLGLNCLCFYSTYSFSLPLCSETSLHAHPEPCCSHPGLLPAHLGDGSRELDSGSPGSPPRL